MSNFKREDRYAVIKYSQLTEKQLGFLKNCIHGEGIPTVKAVVVESDWPEYEPVWKMIEDRVTGAPVEGGKAEYDEMAKDMTNDIKISRELAERLARVYPSNITDTATLLTVRAQSMGALEELRALLAAPVVESQEPVAIVTSVISRKNKLFEIDILNNKSLTIGDKLYTAPVVECQESVDAETRIVPLSLLAAACSAIDQKRDAPKVLSELRRHTLGDLAKPASVAVVLPERPYASEDDQQNMTDYEIGLGHGACEMWDKVKELNQ